MKMYSINAPRRNDIIIKREIGFEVPQRFYNYFFFVSQKYIPDLWSPHRYETRVQMTFEREGFPSLVIRGKGGFHLDFHKGKFMLLGEYK